MSKIVVFGRGGQKRYFWEFSYRLEPVRHNHAKGVYGINAKHCMESVA